MAPKVAHRRAASAGVTVWLLSRLRGGHGEWPEHLGVFTSDRMAMSEADQVIKRECGLPPSGNLRLAWRREGDLSVLHYGRDAHRFTFRLEPSVVDGVQ